MDSDNQVSYGAPSQKKFGPIIATLVVILILIIAALWLFASKSNEEPVPAANTPAEEGVVQAVTNTSTEPADLQSDLNASVEGLENI